MVAENIVSRSTFDVYVCFLILIKHAWIPHSIWVIFSAVLWNSARKMRWWILAHPLRACWGLPILKAAVFFLNECFSSWQIWDHGTHVIGWDSLQFRGTVRCGISVILSHNICVKGGGRSPFETKPPHSHTWIRYYMHIECDRSCWIWAVPPTIGTQWSRCPSMGCLVVFDWALGNSNHTSHQPTSCEGWLLHVNQNTLAVGGFREQRSSFKETGIGKMVGLDHLT